MGEVELVFRASSSFVYGDSAELPEPCTSLNALWDHIRGIVETGIEARQAPARAGGMRDRLTDLTRAADLLGYRPAIALREGLRRTVESLRGSSGPGMGTRQ